MKKSSLSTREIVMIVLLVVLLGGVIYYMGFLTPLQNELADIKSQTVDVETQIESYTEKLTQLTFMENTLKELDKKTEVAPYDNLVEVLVAMNQYLKENAISYNVDFMDPEVAEDGTTRRVVSMEIECLDYASARAMVDDLTGSKWRCLVRDTVIVPATDGNENLLTGPVKVELEVTFFEISDTASTPVTDPVAE